MLDWTKKFEELDQEFKDEVAEMEEINCYFLINMLGGVVWRYNHDTADGRIESTEDAEQDIMGLRIKQTYVVRQLTRLVWRNPVRGPRRIMRLRMITRSGFSGGMSIVSRLYQMRSGQNLSKS